MFQKNKTMKTKNYFNIPAAAVAATICLFSSCNPDIRLNADEDAPKIAEHVLGMPTEQAAKYLTQSGFVESISTTLEYKFSRTFSKDPNLSDFSEEAALLLTIAHNGTDTVHHVSILQRVSVQYEKKAHDLYQKWSHYTAEVTLPNVEEWIGHLGDPDSINTPHRWIYYSDGTTVKHNKQVLEEAYRKGEISKEEYEQMIAAYARTREQFWSDYKSKVYAAEENYRNNGREFPKKEIHLILELPDDIREIYPPIDYYTLYYYTADYVSSYILCE